MSNVFRIHVLPAQRGDSLWIEYGTESAPSHIIIDGGITTTGGDHLFKRLKEIAPPFHIELLVVTHIDLDHIQGVIKFLEDLPSGITFGDIWFNGLEQIRSTGLNPMGIKEGIRLSKILRKNHNSTWNKAANGNAIALNPNGGTVSHSLDGGMVVTVLGPTLEQLTLLGEQWDLVMEEFAADEEAETESKDPPGLSLEALGLRAMGGVDIEGLAKSDFVEDKAIPNGSSIALLLEFKGRSALMLGDAYPSVIASSIRQLSDNGYFKADVVKVAHHGSRNNTDLTLAGLLSAPAWIFSSNGANNTKHPHLESVARVLYGSGGGEEKTLIFNYRTKFNEIWCDKGLMEEFRYRTVYGDGESSVLLELL
ncbi:ComEC/Rec2 family competence protein [Metapseudomonas otitidis]|uniref:Metallo-beta-lactamase domain-containing protein n=1 Tax=Metapseudomonas otitidis TaxID=319939 RepID=A0A679GCW3_9GAMM|nr:hypothetical protein [Pseudomonas otitidis]BCA26732.1 hypothetical protein PtoMrB4_07090 [Pseudomonas otitidis]